MRKEKKKIVYLSGPISGQEMEKARIAFNTKAMILEIRYGVEVLNPFDNELPEDASWEAHMRADIRMMMCADVVLMLPYWERSDGANVERALAMTLGMPICYSTGDIEEWLAECEEAEKREEQEEPEEGREA